MSESTNRVQSLSRLVDFLVATNDDQPGYDRESAIAAIESASHEELLQWLEDAIGWIEDQQQTYQITRFCFDENDPQHRQVQATGLTYAEARAWCNRPDTHHEEVVDGRTVTTWFDGMAVE